MSDSVLTCWTIVRDAARGDGEACSVFARTYLDVVRAFLGKRWKGSPLAAQIDDAVQEVFLDLFREDGALARLDRARAASFRSFLFGVTHKVALRHEERRRRMAARQSKEPFEPDAIPSVEATLSRVFDREWALSLLRRAIARHQSLARAAGDAALRRAEILRLRFAEDLTMAAIATRLSVETTVLQHEYARARAEFKAALCAEVRNEVGEARASVTRELEELLGLLGG